VHRAHIHFILVPETRLLQDIIRTAFENGINMFDTAEEYSGGKSEEEMLVDLIFGSIWNWLLTRVRDLGDEFLKSLVSGELTLSSPRNCSGELYLGPTMEACRANSGFSLFPRQRQLTQLGCLASLKALRQASNAFSLIMLMSFLHTGPITLACFSQTRKNVFRGFNAISPPVPMEEMVRAFNFVIEKGWVSKSQIIWLRHRLLTARTVGVLLGDLRMEC
jgi:hypothetical protein